MRVSAETKNLSVYMQNKQALEKTIKMYFAFEARHGVALGDFRSWVYPVSLVLAPRTSDGKYWNR